jgi:hypothetical protein
VKEGGRDSEGWLGVLFWWILPGAGELIVRGEEEKRGRMDIDYFEPFLLTCAESFLYLFLSSYLPLFSFLLESRSPIGPPFLRRHIILQKVL